MLKKSNPLLAAPLALAVPARIQREAVATIAIDQAENSLRFEGKKRGRNVRYARSLRIPVRAQLLRVKKKARKLRNIFEFRFGVRGLQAKSGTKKAEDSVNLRLPSFGSDTDDTASAGRIGN